MKNLKRKTPGKRAAREKGKDSAEAKKGFEDAELTRPKYATCRREEDSLEGFESWGPRVTGRHSHKGGN